MTEDLRIHGMAGHVIRRLHQRSMQGFAEAMRAAGLDLTPVQYAALETLAERPGLDQAGLAATIACDRATLGGVVERLEVRGLVARRPSQTDRRARVLALTPAGAAAVTQARPVVMAVQDDILTGLTPDERSRFLTLAAKLLDG